MASPALVRFRRGYEHLLEAIVILLMVALAALVTIAVVYRKLNAPIIWYDEVATILLAWLTYYGAALGALKGAHIAVGGLIDPLPPKVRLAITIFAEICVIGFFVVLAWAGWSILDVLATDYLVTLPEVSNDWVQSVIAIGSVLFVIAELLRLPDVLRQAAGPASGSILMGIAALFIGVLALVLLSVPIAVALGVAALVAMVATQGLDALANMAIVMFTGTTKFPLIAIPLFILAGAIMNTSGISRRLIAFASALLGFVRGGLAMVNVGTSLFFAEISGSAVADVAALGSVLMPAMKKKGYPGPFAAAITSSSASLAIIIPPSIPMILYAVMAGTSVVQLFVAGIIPGLMGGLMMMGLCYYYAVRYGWPVEETFRLKHLWRTFKDASLALLLPVIILGGIFGGIVTATEGAGVAVAAAVGIALWYREIDLKQLKIAIVDGAVQTAVVMLLVATSALLGVYLTETQAPQKLAQGIIGITQEPWAVLALLNVFFFFIGLFLHSAAAIILVVPIVMPLVEQVGIDPVHFGLVVTLNMAIGQQTPPVASVLMTACSIARENVWDVTRANLPFIGVLLAVLLLVTYIPAIPLSLVRFFYG